MDKRLSDFDKVMSCLLEPLGDYAPKRRYLLLDYNDSSGADLHHEALQYVPRGVTDRDLVRLFWEDLARQGYRLSSICEPQEDGGIAILYAAPGFLEECFSDQGLPVPDSRVGWFNSHDLDHLQRWPRVASVWRKGVERRAAPGVPVRPFFGRATSATVTNKSVRNRPVSGRLASGPKGGANFVPLQMGG